LFENDVLWGDPRISLVSTAAAKELRDCYYSSMVRKSIGLGDDPRQEKYPRVGLQ
jgi:hypothetical protein